jgi:ATP-dependent exoDNAse (exonuclease V) beta subunit
VYANLSGARNLAAFVALGRHMVDRIYEHQRRFGVMLNQTWPHLAVTALSGQSGVTDAFCRLGASLSAILMDEFQDTSREQWEALKPLAEECLSTGGRLFIVGDVKQSIYGWRGGEAGLFAEAAADPELTAIADVKQSSLEYNWRSLERIIDFNNEIFARLGVPDTAMRVAREMAGGDSAGARRLSESVADAFADAGQANPPNTPNPGGYVRLQKIRGDNKEDILELVREALRDAVVYDLLERRAPGDVAVLVRTNSEASLVSKWLIDWGAPVVTENSLRLGEHPLIRELLSALAFLDYPLDDASFFEFVSGGRILHPIGGPGREQLFAWLASDPGARPLYPRFRESFPDAWEKLLAPFVRRSGLMGPYDTVREMVRAYGLLERFPGDEAFLRRFLEVVFAAEQSGRLSLSSFLEYWRESGPEEKVPLPEHLDAVRVLTMHKAKGLEFPVVVAPFHHWTLDVSDNAVVHEFEGRRLLAPLKKGLGDTYHRALAPLLQEQLHLLYVAWTRPREELYCMLTSAPFYDTRSPISKALDVLLEDTRFHEDEYGRVVHEVGEPPETPAPPPRPEAPSGPAAASEPESVPEPMSWLPRLKIHRNLSMDMGRDELLSAGPLFDERARGTVFHEALNLATGRGSGVDPELLAARSLAAAPVPHPPEAAKELAQALEWVLGQDELSTYLSAGEPETSIMDESGKLHRPDLIAHGDFGTAVVEYKTGDAQPEHENQVRRYMDMVRAMRRFPKPVYGVIAYLDLRRVVRVEGG